ncbi:tetratricopeptide repeat protein, partial [Glaesserella parasuis]
QAWDEARIYLEELVERDSHVDAAHFNLGRLAEEQKDTARALDEYAQVGPGNDFLPAQLRQTDVLLKAGRVDEAAQRLDKARSEQPDYAIQLYLIEAEAL